MFLAHEAAAAKVAKTDFAAGEGAAGGVAVEVADDGAEQVADKGVAVQDYVEHLPSCHSSYVAPPPGDRVSHRAIVAVSILPCS